jgi:hypothetical protein
VIFGLSEVGDGNLFIFIISSCSFASILGFGALRGDREHFWVFGADSIFGCVLSPRTHTMGMMYSGIRFPCA